MGLRITRIRLRGGCIPCPVSTRRLLSEETESYRILKWRMLLHHADSILLSGDFHLTNLDRTLFVCTVCDAIQLNDMMYDFDEYIRRGSNFLWDDGSLKKSPPKQRVKKPSRLYAEVLLNNRRYARICFGKYFYRLVLYSIAC